jgi:hypothetical protein
MILNRRAARAAIALASLTAACAASPTLAAPAGPIVLEPRVMLTVQQRERLQVIANEGPDALRRYLWRTRMIYGWTWHDLVGGE